MKNWGQEFGLINLTRLKQNDHELNDRLRDGTLRKLTAEIAMDAAAYRELPPWDKAAARAFAVGMTMDKAVVGGTGCRQAVGAGHAGGGKTCGMLPTQGRYPELPEDLA